MFGKVFEEDQTFNYVFKREYLFIIKRIVWKPVTADTTIIDASVSTIIDIVSLRFYQRECGEFAA